jgi:Membrane protein implicated in regulation of membrane protease activity
MDPATIAIILIIIGLIFLITEALTPGFFAVIPGAILVVVGVLGYFIEDYFDNLTLLLLTVIVVSIVVSIVTIKGYQILAKPVPPSTTVTESMIGRTGIVTARINPNDIKGKVKIGNDTWSATSDEVIEMGAEIYVYAGEGVHLKVRYKD